jgi:hypothetical protein
MPLHMNCSGAPSARRAEREDASSRETLVATTAGAVHTPESPIADAA